MTQLLHIANPLQMTFTAHVQHVTGQDGFSDVILDQICFYPTGGGQSHDRGTLAGFPVLDVRKENGTVIHRVQGELMPGQQVQGLLDASYRLNNMHAHSGQHLLSATFFHLLDAPTVAVKMNAEGVSTVDIDRANLTDDELRQVEDRANNIIREDRPIKSYYLAPDDPKLEELRRAVKFEKVTGDVRIVEIEGWDLSACAGTHVPSTGMLGLLKLLKAENYKGGSRVHFVAGSQALEIFQQEHAILAEISQQFSTSVDGLLASVSKLQAERQE
ncbi:MAG: alanyl-tRNA editing protein, partial [Anaerolineae bacterium]|nr:alanyl-tRNA editing protein [Anaerolineae bacterium]